MFPLRNNSSVNCFIMVSKRERSSRRVISRCSGNPLPFIICSLFAIFSCSFLHCSARDTITMNSSLSDGNEETLVSAGGRFELGFFTPNISKNRRYVGIWYHKSNPRLVVWVANRGKPLVDNNGVLAIEDANLKLLDAKGTSYFSATAKGYSSPNLVAKLMDSGNLVLSDDQSAKSIWESFQQPTDTFLTGMKMDENLILTSWASADDPKAGDFTFSTVQNCYVVKNRYYTYWKSGESGKFLSGDVMPSPITYLLSNFSPSAKPNNANSSHGKLIWPSIGYGNKRLTMSFTGKIQYWSKDKEESWSLIWEEPRDNCSLYNFCGSFGSCNSNNNLKCKCLPGFVPKSPVTWESGDFSGGCQRKNGTCGGNDKFLPLKMMKVQNPDVLISGKSKTECLTDCRNNCKCQAYAHDEANNGTRRTDPTTPAMCWIWTDDLNGLQEEYFNGGRDLYVRVSATDIENGYSMQDLRKHSKKQWILIVGLTVASLIVLSCTVIYFYLRRRKVKRQENRENVGRNMAVRFYDSARHVKDLVDTEQFKEVDKKAIDLPFFEFESILAATDNFSEANKLGKGGFGPVYKGKFHGGQEVAVKRLSRVSGQGLEEFKNEVVLIARLQHRNLVRLLGYCIEGAEQILLYEYMPNKSLDSFIFDPKLKELLDWETRFNIIMGIARGLLYLHQDSRLRIIHRDLKTSNVLLDHEMNPKISDFGLAKIFEGKQTEGTTARVVGTYGYMSPEYALDGFFSVKSDVFSFGVVVLEIVSGKRNTGSYDSKEALSLLGYTWRLWQEDKALDIMDQKLGASSKRNEVLKCINIGLLCAQEDPNDRPNMSNVIFMLGSEPATLPIPKRPAFVLRRGPSFTASSSSKPDTNMELTVSLAGR